MTTVHAELAAVTGGLDLIVDTRSPGTVRLTATRPDDVVDISNVLVATLVIPNAQLFDVAVQLLAAGRSADVFTPTEMTLLTAAITGDTDDEGVQ